MRFSKTSGFTIEIFRDHFGDSQESPGTPQHLVKSLVFLILHSCEKNFGDDLGTIWERFCTLGTLWGRFGDTFGHFGTLFGTLHHRLSMFTRTFGALGDSLGTPWGQLHHRLSMFIRITPGWGPPVLALHHKLSMFTQRYTID